jgi:hypothetical protein
MEIAVALVEVGEGYDYIKTGEDYEFYYDRVLNPFYGIKKNLLVELFEILNMTETLRDEVLPKVFVHWRPNELCPDKFRLIEDINEETWQLDDSFYVYDRFIRLYLREELPSFCYVKGKEAWRAFEKHDRRLFESFRDERICKGSKYPIPGIKEPISHKDKEALKEAREEFDYLLNSVSDNREDRKIKMKYAKDKIYHIIFGIK